MALTLQELTTARDALMRARADGVRRYTDQNGETVEYKSDSEMARALAALDSAIAAATSAPPSTFTFRTSKGL
jgi:hypothetical protein